MALEALKDLFVTNLLPDGRRLVPFEARPLMQALAAVEASSAGGDKGSNSNTPGQKGAASALLMWYFEDQVGFAIELYAQVVEGRAGGEGGGSGEDLRRTHVKHCVFATFFYLHYQF